MTPEEQSYIDNVADTMDPETAKLYLEYEALKVKLRDDVKVIGRRAKYKAIWLGIMILSIPLWGYVIAQYWNWFVSLAGFHTITWLQGYCLVFAFQMLRTNFGRIELNDPCANYLHKMAILRMPINTRCRIPCTSPLWQLPASLSRPCSDSSSAGSSAVSSTHKGGLYGKNTF